jgi:cell division control protein 7
VVSEHQRYCSSVANRAEVSSLSFPDLCLIKIYYSALDMWSAGIILLFFLTAKFPLFQSNDDMEALIEIASVVGKTKMEKAATLHSRFSFVYQRDTISLLALGRTFTSNLPTITKEGLSWKEFIERQNPNLYTPLPPDSRFYPHNVDHGRRAGTHPPTSSSPTSGFSIAGSSQRSRSPPVPSISISDVEAHRADVKAAIELAEQLLDPESTKRISARHALRHRFLAEEDAPDDDELAPHRFGRGVCGHLHFVDDVTGAPCVKVRVVRDGKTVMAVRTLVAGEGVAYGNRPCEFHIDEFP